MAAITRRAIGVAGIDFGASSVKVCVDSDRGGEYLKSKEGGNIPSVVSVKDNGITAGSSKGRFMLNQLKQRLARVGPHNATDVNYYVAVGDVRFELSPTDAIAELLKLEYEAAKLACINNEIKAVITVPASFSGNAVKELIYATEISGFEVIGVFPEPVAGAYSILNYIESHNFAEFIRYGSEYNLVVYDFGGFTFDYALIYVNNDTYKVQRYISKECIGGYYIAKELVEKYAENLSEAMKEKEITNLMGTFGNNNVPYYYLRCGLNTHPIKKSEINECILKYVKMTEELVDIVMPPVDSELPTILCMVGGMCTCNVVSKEIIEHYKQSRTVVDNTFLYDVARGAMLLGQSLCLYNRCNLVVENWEGEELCLNHDVVICIGGQTTKFTRNQDVLRIARVLDIHLQNIGRLRIRCYYDYEMRSEDKYIINKEMNIFTIGTVKFTCTIDRMKCLRITSSSAEPAYNKEYSGFIIEHCPVERKDDHYRRINDINEKLRASSSHR